MKLDIAFRLTGQGWAECRLVDENAESTVTASYLSDALRHLVLAATAVLSGFRRVTFTFDEEPGQFRWVISSLRMNEIELNLLEFKNLWSDESDSEGVRIFRTICRPRVFAEAVDAATSKLLCEIGEVGYAERWGQHPWPSLQYQELKRLLATNAEIT
jgi:hypothetical protein